MKSKNKTKAVRLLAIAVLILLQVLYCVYYCNQKQNLNVDGYFTFNLANSTGNSSNAGVFGNIMTPQQYAETVLSDPAGVRFNFSQVWEAQASDTHPPLYYALINILCSIIQPVFSFTVSMWIGLWVNIAFAIGSTLVSFAILKKLTRSDFIAYAGALVTVVSPAVVEMTTFVRMYNMANFFVMLIVLWHCVYWQESLTPKRLLPLFLCCTCAFLTHYFTLPFVFCIAFWFGLRLLWRHRIKEAAFYAAATIGSVGATILIFPATLRHIFKQGRGREALENLSDSSMAERLLGENGTLRLMNRFVLGNRFAFILVLFFALAILAFFQFLVRKRSFTALDKPETMLLFAFAINFILITKIAAFLTIRYFYFICLPLLISLIVLLTKITRCFIKEHWTQVALVMAIFMFVCTTAFPDRLSYLYPQTAEHLQQIAEDGVDTTVYLGSQGWKIMPAFREFMAVDTLCFIDSDTLDILTQSGIPEKPFYLYLENTESVRDELFPVFEEMLSNVEMTFRYTFACGEVYYCCPN